MFFLLILFSAFFLDVLTPADLWFHSRFPRYLHLAVFVTQHEHGRGGIGYSSSWIILSSCFDIYCWTKWIPRWSCLICRTLPSEESARFPRDLLNPTPSGFHQPPILTERGNGSNPGEESFTPLDLEPRGSVAIFYLPIQKCFPALQLPFLSWYLVFLQQQHTFFNGWFPAGARPRVGRRAQRGAATRLTRIEVGSDEALRRLWGALRWIKLVVLAIPRSILRCETLPGGESFLSFYQNFVEVEQVVHFRKDDFCQ